MAFKNLEQRFNEKVNQLYAGAKSKFDDGRPSRGVNDDPLIVRRPGDGYWGFGEGRGAPIRSAAQDLKRLTLFTASFRGIAFLAKQQLLQTGNTFEAQRVINPLFAVGNAVPFLHTKRSLDIPVTARGIGRQLLGGGALASRIFGSGKQQTAPDSLRRIAQLQSETYNKLAGTPPSGLSFLKRIPVIGQTVSAFSAKRSVGENIDFKLSRPELKDYIVNRYNRIDFTFKYGGKVTLLSKYGYVGGALIPYSTANVSKNNGVQRLADDYKWTATPRAAIIDKEQTPNPLVNPLNGNNLGREYAQSEESKRLVDQQKKYLATGDEMGGLTVEKTPYIKYFRPDTQGSITGLEKKFDERNGVESKVVTRTEGQKISFMRDKFNKPISGRPSGRKLEAYRNLPSTADLSGEDPIVVSFAMGKDDPVQFRAFISNIQQSASPEYKNYQYIGRIDKFVSYVSVQRDVSFKLGVLAFSKDELDIVWKRINYLTALVYPYGINKGILQPNIVRLTIGNLYINQPGYVSSLSTNFNDITESWDIDRQVPIGATMDIKFSIIEKRTTVASTPLYGITENIEGFSTTLTPQAPPTGTQ